MPASLGISESMLFVFNEASLHEATDKNSDKASLTSHFLIISPILSSLHHLVHRLVSILVIYVHACLSLFWNRL